MRTSMTVFLMMALCAVLSAADFFSPGGEEPAGLKNDAVYPAGRLFPFGGFAPADIAAMKRDGFTFAGPAYSAWQQGVLDRGSKKQRMPQIRAIHLKLRGEPFGKKHLDRMSDEEFASVRDQVVTQVRAAAADPMIAWWYLTPEELRPWRTNDMRFFREACAAIRENDPAHRPIWIYLPNHYTAEQMEIFAKNNEILGKGMYPIQLGKERDRVWNLWSTDNELKAIRAVGAHDTVAICVPEMFKEVGANAPEIGVRVRYDVWSSLLSGARGVVIFSLAKRPNFPSYDAYYKAYSTLAKELTGDDGLGQVLLFGRPLDDLKVRVLDGPKKVKVNVGINGKNDIRQYPSILWRGFAWRNQRYWFGVNSSPDRNVTVELTGFPAESAVALDAVSGATIATSIGGAMKLTFRPYEVILLKIVRKRLQ